MYFAIAMDGPAASGKTTIGQMVAEALGFLLLDTGAMYRATTLAALRANIDLEQETAVFTLATQIQIDIKDGSQAHDGRIYTVLLDGNDVTWALRETAVDQNVSLISSYPDVRHRMVARQREMAEEMNVVMVGRDIGTVVLPHAPLKLYVTASAEERARRRWSERQKRGHNESYEAILQDVIRRDKIDASRQHSPMRPAKDAILLDTTGHTPAEVVKQILSLVAERKQPVTL